VPTGFLVGLGPVDREQTTGGPVLDVGEVQSDQLGDPQGGGEAEQEDRGVAGALGGGTVDRGKDLAEVGDVEGSGLAAGCGADDAPQSTADLADCLARSGVLESADAVAIRDRADSEVQGGDRGSVARAVGEIGADQRRRSRDRCNLAGYAPAFPPVPAQVVDAPGGIGQRGVHGLGDEERVLDSQALRQLGQVGKLAVAGRSARSVSE